MDRKSINHTYRRSMVLFLAIVLGISQVLAGKPRVIVMTDIGGDPDDQQTMVRFLSYANEFEIKGLYATSNGRAEINVSVIEQMVRAWGSSYGNLTMHATGWPEKDDLSGIIKAGRPVEGIYWCGIGKGVRDPQTGHAGGICTPQLHELIGEGMDSEASDHLISVIDGSAEPTWVLAWGGTRELAQAIWKVRDTRPESELNNFLSRIRLYSISLQDQSLPWLLSEFPGLFIIRTVYSHRGIYRYDKLDTALLNRTWCNTHLRNGHGALGAWYPGNLKGTFDKNGMKEGDTPSLTYLISNGLSDPEDPGMGNWGGRFYATLGDKHWFEAEDDNPYADDQMLRVYWSVSRWQLAMQNDFEARMDWQRTGEYEDANHNPAAVLNGDNSKDVIYHTVPQGVKVQMSAAGSSDPDGDALHYRWWEYYEIDSSRGPGSCPGPGVFIAGANLSNASFITPSGDSPRTIHIILEVTDDGSPNLTSYRRLVVEVEP